MNDFKTKQGSGPHIGEIYNLSHLDTLSEPHSQKQHSLSSVIEDKMQLFQGMPNWGHPSSMFNVITKPCKASIISSMKLNILNPNLMEGETCKNVAKAETELVAMIERG